MFDRETVQQFLSGDLPARLEALHQTLCHEAGMTGLKEEVQLHYSQMDAMYRSEAIHPGILGGTRLPSDEMAARHYDLPQHEEDSLHQLEKAAFHLDAILGEVNILRTEMEQEDGIEADFDTPLVYIITSLERADNFLQQIAGASEIPAVSAIHNELRTIQQAVSQITELP